MTRPSIARWRHFQANEPSAGTWAVLGTLAVFEAVHGSAPDIAGRNLANPLALLMSAVMMLNHLAETRDDEACATAARRIRDGYNRALAEGAKTRDLGGTLGTSEFAEAIVRHLSD